MARKVVKQAVHEHPRARPVNAGSKSEPTSIAGRQSQMTSKVSRHPEAMRNGALSLNPNGVEYVDARCVFIRKDGTKCVNPRLNNHEVCLGHVRVKRDNQS